MTFECTIMQICDTTEQFVTHFFNGRKGPHKYRVSLQRDKLVSCMTKLAFIRTSFYAKSYLVNRIT